MIVGSAEIELRPDGDAFPAQAERSIKGGQGQIVGAFKGIALAAAATFAVAFSADRVVGFFRDSIGAASDLSEETSKAGVIFGDAAGQVEAFASTASGSIGQSRQQAIAAASTFATFGKGAGLAGDDLAGFSTDLVSLTSDMASFSNTTPEQAIEAVGAALRGESEPIRQYGVLLDDATLKNRALELGLIDTTKNALTPQQKVLAAQAEILAQTSDAQGDFARTSEGLANQQRQAAAQFTDLQAVIGELLLPAMTTLMQYVNTTVLPGFLEFFTIVRDSGLREAISETFNIPPDSPIFAFLDRVTLGLQGLSALIIDGDYQGKLREAFGWDEDSAVVDMILDIRDAVTGLDFAGITTAVREFFTAGGDDSLATSFRSIYDSAVELTPAVQAFLDQMPGFGELTQVAAGALAFLADNVDTIIALMPVLVGVVVAYKVAQLASNVAVAASPVIRLLEVGAMRAQTAAVRQLAAAHATGTVATTTNTTATSVGLGARIASTVATTAAAVAQRAVAAAQAVATAAQWALNAALTANPIGIVVVLLAALVAGIVIAYQRSETFRNIVNGAWAAVRSAVGTVVEWLSTAVPAAFQFVLSAIQRFTPLGFIVSNWGSIKSAVSGAADAVKSAVSRAFQAVLSFIQRYTPLGFIVSNWAQIKSSVSSAATSAKDAVVRAFTALVDGAKSRISDLLGTARGLGSSILSAIGNLAGRFTSIGSDIISGIVTGITRGIGRITGAARDAASAALNAAKDFLGISSPSKAFRDQVGAESTAGVVLGLEQGTDDVTAAARRMADAAVIAGASTFVVDPFPTSGITARARTVVSPAGEASRARTAQPAGERRYDVGVNMTREEFAEALRLQDAVDRVLIGRAR